MNSKDVGMHKQLEYSCISIGDGETQNLVRMREREKKKGRQTSERESKDNLTNTNKCWDAKKMNEKFEK